MLDDPSIADPEAMDVAEIGRSPGGLDGPDGPGLSPRHSDPRDDLIPLSDEVFDLDVGCPRPPPPQPARPPPLLRAAGRPAAPRGGEGGGGGGGARPRAWGGVQLLFSPPLWGGEKGGRRRFFPKGVGVMTSLLLFAVGARVKRLPTLNE